MPGPNEKLESFLSAQEPAPADTPTPPAPEPQTPAEPAKPGEPPAKPGEAVAKPGEPVDEPDDDEPPREARPGEVAVPRHAYEAERNRRQNWVERAARAEAQAEELRKQMEALAKQQQAPPPQQQQQPGQQFQFTPWEVDPARRYQEELVNEKFERSELMMRSKHGDEIVDQLINDFAQLTAQNPTLRMQLFAQRDPFGWAHKEVERQRLLREMDGDPTAYRAKLRAEWEAEQQTKAPPQVQLPQNTPPPAMPPSLAGVRSAAPRGAPAWSGPLSDQQFVEDMRSRRMAQRNGHS